MNMAELGTFLLGVAAVIGALAAAYGQISMSRKIRDIDHAVNGKPKGAMPMQKQVADLHSDRPKPPEELNDAPVKQMLKLLVADMYERRNG